MDDPGNDADDDDDVPDLVENFDECCKNEAKETIEKVEKVVEEVVVTPAETPAIVEKAKVEEVVAKVEELSMEEPIVDKVEDVVEEIVEKVIVLQAWYGPCNYSFSGLDLKKNPNWAPELLELLHRLFGMTKNDFNTCSANLYEHGHDICCWHSDVQSQLRKNPAIASGIY